MDLEALLLSESESENIVTDSDSAESDSDEDLIQEGYNTLNLLDSLDAMDEEDECTSAIHQLAYDIAPDAFDEYLHMGASTSRDYLKNYCKCIIHMFSREYLRKPTEEDVRRLHAKHLEMHGFPSMLGSLDCMHWASKNCPVAWQGHYHRGDHEGPTIMLEAVASYDMWILHAFFGQAGSNNDINVLNESNLFEDLLDS
ncbi:uncharacterized protein [Rutidosis leptorrhynchoides]|uniref:uncharacterized protein n=1 Tax=Rutidosis leptorrhynchoides TaxID=125765 RepID=UPI003A99B9F4